MDIVNILRDKILNGVNQLVDERNLKEIFDRRHTVTSCQKIKSADEVPGAEYERAYPSNGGIFNDFLYKSILTMASMHGNVYGPIVEDTKILLHTPTHNKSSIFIIKAS